MKKAFLLYNDDQEVWPWNSCVTTHSLNRWQSQKQEIAKLYQNTANQWENPINEDMCVSKEFLSHFRSLLTVSEFKIALCLYVWNRWESIKALELQSQELPNVFRENKEFEGIPGLGAWKESSFLVDSS